MKTFHLALILFCTALFLFISCSKSTPLGSELLEDDQVDIKYVDTISLNAVTIRRDSVRTYGPQVNLQLGTYLTGDMSDPVFGNSVASIYAQLRLPISFPQGLQGAVLDSVVLRLAYDTLGFYGDSTQSQSIEIYEIDETIDNTVTYFSNKTFSIKPEKLASINDFVPKPYDQITVIHSDDTTVLAPHLRIPLDMDFGNRLLMLDSLAFVTNEAFLEEFGGIYIKPAKQTNAMIGFDLVNPATRLSLYYTSFEDDTTALEYVFQISSASVKVTNFEHDYSLSLIDFNNTVQGDSILFVQGMSGVDARIEIPFADQFKDVIVNKAVLEVTVATLPGDDTDTYSPLERVVISELTEEGELFLIEDVTFNLNNLDSRFGSKFVKETGVNGEEIMVFRLNISGHMQRIIEGTATKQIVISAFGKQESPGRTIIYGPGHSVYPMNISMTYTQLN